MKKRDGFLTIAGQSVIRASADYFKPLLANRVESEHPVRVFRVKSGPLKGRLYAMKADRLGTSKYVRLNQIEHSHFTSHIAPEVAVALK
jgi:hypothetical protein